jgi:hypothetical protein
MDLMQIDMDLMRGDAAKRAEAIKASYIMGRRTKGFFFTVPGGASTQSISLSGMGRIFLGFAFYNFTSATITTQLVINESVVVESTNAQFFQVDGDGNGRDYYEFKRGLNGQDTITFSFQNTGANVNLALVIYYI